MRPRSAPAGWWLNYHPLKTDDIGPDGCIVTTDTSPVLNALGGLYAPAFNPESVRAYAAKCRAKNRGFLLYGWGHKAIDTASLSALAGIP